MAKYKFKKGMSLGSLAAENDRQFLEKAFVDTGLTEALINAADPKFIVLGGTGSGKTALLWRLENGANATSLDPSELSMQWMLNSDILNRLLELGVNLDPFYKYLWRHVFVMELIKARWLSAEQDDSVIDRIRKFFSGRSAEMEERARAYADQYGDEFWLSTERVIQTTTEGFEEHFKRDAELGGWCRTASA